MNIPTPLLWKVRSAFRWLSGSKTANSLASRAWNSLVCQGHGQRLREEFTEAISRACDFCGAPLNAHPNMEYGHCRRCNVLLSGAPMPNYGENELYIPSESFISENIGHYERLFAARPKLLEAIARSGIREVIDLAGGTGIFPRMLATSLSGIQRINIVEVGAYANSPELHRLLSERLQTSAPVSFVQENVFAYLGNPANVCPDDVLISCVHFIDHLRAPHDFLKALRNFARNKRAYLLMYCHALDSYKGQDWFVINTGTPGEHQIVYSHRALRQMLSEYGAIEHGEVYFDDQYLLVRLIG